MSEAAAGSFADWSRIELRPVFSLDVLSGLQAAALSGCPQVDPPAGVRECHVGPLFAFDGRGRGRVENHQRQVIAEVEAIASRVGEQPVEYRVEQRRLPASFFVSACQQQGSRLQEASSDRVRSWDWPFSDTDAPGVTMAENGETARDRGGKISACD